MEASIRVNPLDLNSLPEPPLSPEFYPLELNNLLDNHSSAQPILPDLNSLPEDFPIQS